MTKIDPVFIRFTQEINATDYLEKVHLFIKKIDQDEYCWKWVIIALHGALYGFAVCACRGTNNLRVVKNEKLISFDEAIKNCQNLNLMRMTTESRCLELTKDQKRSIKILKKELRNNFEHYIPMSWSIEIHGLPEIFIDILDIIEFLALKTGNYVILEESQREKIKLYIEESKEILRNHKLYKETI